MPSFKPKYRKKIQPSITANITVDCKHEEKLNRFKQIHTDLIPKLKHERQNIINQLKYTHLKIDKRLDMIDDKRDINQKILQLQNEKRMYYLDNAEYVFSYFEKKKTVSKDKNKIKVLNHFFNKVTKSDQSPDNIKVIHKYLTNMDESLIDINNYITSIDGCNKNGCRGELILVEHEGVQICNRCGIQQLFLISHEKPSFKEPPKEVCFYAYKRINHFREILAQFQAKETTQIPEEVLNGMKLQIKKERINIKDITNKKAKDILKKLGYNKYYEHIPYIKEKMGIKPPIMSHELEDKLCSLFMDIQKPYSLHCPDDRVNFLNYYYVLYKICELLGETTFLPYFPMLKDPIKRIEQDEIWKKICDELQWEYVPTI
jgi:hypothetical protein